MNAEKPLVEFTDSELIAEWNCIECDTEDRERTEALAAEMGKRDIDF